MLSVMKVSMTLAPWAGIPAGAVQNQRHRDPGHCRDDEVQQHRRHHDRPERRVAIEREREEPGDRAPHQAVDQADGELLADQLPVLLAELVERQRANDQRHGLIAGVAADAGDDRHQRRERDDAGDRRPRTAR